MFENKPAHVSYDPKANAFYIQIARDGTMVDKTESIKHSEIHLDKDEDGYLIGIEILLDFDDITEIKVR